MKTYQEFITELNKFEAAMKAGKVGIKALKKVFADPKTGAFKINTTRVTNPLANAMFKKKGLKKRIKPRYEVDTDDILPMTAVVETEIKRREDAVTDGGYVQDVTANAPSSDDDYFAVPKVVE